MRQSESRQSYLVTFEKTEKQFFDRAWVLVDTEEVVQILEGNSDWCIDATISDIKVLIVSLYFVDFEYVSRTLLSFAIIMDMIQVGRASVLVLAEG